MTATQQRKAPQTPARTAISDRRSVLIFVVTLLVMLTADLLVKWLAFEHVAGQPVVLNGPAASTRIHSHEGVMLVPKVLSLQLTLNEGAVFGLGEGGRWIFIAFSLVAAGVICVIFARSAAGRIVLHLSLAAVLAGALGNLYDRLRFGVVRDMLHLFPDVHLPFGWRWPNGSSEVYPWIFNIADVCLVIGLLLLLVLLYREDGGGRQGDKVTR